MKSLFPTLRGYGNIKIYIFILVVLTLVHEKVVHEKPLIVIFKSLFHTSL